jgi:hypothetical protein
VPLIHSKTMTARRFAGEQAVLGPELCARMTGKSWHPDPRCPPFEALRVLTLPHWDFAGGVCTGQLVVAAALAEEVLDIFAELHAQEFPIARMEPIDAFGGDDDASMAANNTSGFNFRNVAGTEVLSDHAFGMAVDINPLMNPMIVGTDVFPPAGAAYLDRGALRSGMIVRPGPVVELFQARGWEWGGDWSHPKDYHHFTRRRSQH